MSGEASGEFLTTAEYERLRRRTETYREDLVVALAGRVGLRAAEIVRVCPADLREREYRGQTHYLLAVPEGDGDAREAYVPPEVAHEIRKFANVNEVDRREPLVDVSARRVQMLVSEVGDRTDGLTDVTCRDLRQHFARRLLADEGVDPRVVQRVGGWQSLQSLAPYLDEPTADEVVTAFADAGRRSPDPGRPPSNREPRPSDRAARPSRRETFPDDAPEPASRSDEPDRLGCAAELGAALAEASTGDEAERAACDRLADAYRAVWVCDERGEVRASAVPDRIDGVPDAVLDAVDPLDADSGDSADDSGDDADDRADAPEVTVVDVPTDGPLSECSFAVTPLRSSETVHGLLWVAAESFSADDRTLVADAGRRVGRTLTAIARKQLLLADTGVALSLRTTDRGVFLVAASADLGCRFELEGVVPVEDHSLLYFVTASGAAVGDVLDRVADADAVDEARLIRDYGDDALFEFAVSGESVAPMLVERGGTVRDLTAEDGVADVSGVFSRRVDVRRVVEAVEEAFPDTHLQSKREVEEPVRTAASVRQAVRDRVTERQRTVLRAAYLAGYFEWPRGSTAEELAASMDVSSPTLHNHLRKAQQKVLDAVFDEPDAEIGDTERH